METIKRGSKGETVKVLQRKLNLLADGIFGNLTEEAVREFQKSKGLTVDGIVGPKTWAAFGDDLNLITKRTIKEIIVHCTATPEGKEYSVAQIRAMHLARGFSDIGYHFLIGLDGVIHKGRDLNIAGAHCTGHNTISIGICYIGGCDAAKLLVNGQLAPKDTRTEAQKCALLNLLKDLKRIYRGAKIHSHRDFANKACPSFDATKEYASL